MRRDHIAHFYFFTVLLLWAAEPLGCGGSGPEAALGVYQFEIEAAAVTLTPDPSGNGNYLLRLEGVSPQVVFLHPEEPQPSGSVDLSQLMEVWWYGRDEFDEPPPSAVLEVLGAAEDQDALSLQLEAPVYSPEDQSITFLAVPQDSTAGPAMRESLQADPIGSFPTQMGPSNLSVLDTQAAAPAASSTDLLQELLAGLSHSPLTDQLQQLSQQLKNINQMLSLVGQFFETLQQLNPDAPGTRDASTLATLQTFVAKLAGMAPTSGLNPSTLASLQKALQQISDPLNGYASLTSNSTRQASFNQIVSGAQNISSLLSNLSIAIQLQL